MTSQSRPFREIMVNLKGTSEDEGGGGARGRWGGKYRKEKEGIFL